MKQLLPLGTIVKVNLGQKSAAYLMIAGYYPKNNETGEVYDYLTVMYPFGMCYKESVQMIKASSIMQIEAMGYMDETAEKFTKELPQLLAEVRGAVQDAVEEALANEEQVKPADDGNLEFG